MKLHVGHENYINNDEIVAIIKPDSAPARNQKTIAKESNKLIDLTSGRKTKAIIIMSTGHVIQSSLTTTVLKERSDQL